MLFAVFFSYAYAYFFGCIWIYRDYINDSLDRVYPGGDVLVVYFGILFGLFALGIGEPNFKAVRDGK